MIKFENHDNGRYYYLFVETDLFGDNVLSVIRGGGDYHRIPVRILVGDRYSINQKIQEITKRRISRGYTLVND
jgi:hypothetical protein